MSHGRVLLIAALACCISDCGGYRSREVGEIPSPLAATDITGTYWFANLDENCEVSGPHSALYRKRDHHHPPGTACSRFGKSDDFLPLPREAWAHPATTLTIRVADGGDVRVELYQGRELTEKARYDSYTFNPASFDDSVDSAQIPLSGGSSTLEWSMSRDDRGLLFTLSDVEKGVFLIVPTHKRFEMTCLLPLAVEAS